MTRTKIALALALLMVLALGLRGLGAVQVFSSDGQVNLAPADSAYHARSALFSFVNFPSLLTVDRYMAYPDGAEVPNPPLADLVLAGVARLFGDDEATFERVAAWWSPFLAALTLLPIFQIGRVLAGPGVGLAAAWLFALLPASISASSVGDVDHHTAVALLGTGFLALSVRLVTKAESEPPQRLVGVCIGMAFVLAAMLLTWSGSLLYLVLGEGALLIVAAVSGRRLVFWGQAAAALGGAVLVTPWLLAIGAPDAAPFAATRLSWLHVVVLIAFAAIAGFAARIVPPREGPGRRLALTLLVGVSAAGALLVIPQLRDSFLGATGFFSGFDTWANRNLEQQALFRWPSGEPAPYAVRYFGWLGWVFPLAALGPALLLRNPRLRAEALCVTLWTLSLGGLALFQLRFTIDFAPMAAVAFTLLLYAAVQPLHRVRPWLATPLAAAVLAAILLVPQLGGTTASALGRLLDASQDAPSSKPARLNPQVSQMHFARMIRDATPETSGYFNALEQPEYGILAKPSLGHAIHYAARRATPANNFGPYLDFEKYRNVLRFYLVPSAQQALALAEGLQVRYVVSFAREASDPRFFHDRLHLADDAGALHGKPTGQLRLVIEGPGRGLPMRTAFPSGRVPGRVIPYKLFELVDGAVLEIPAAPGVRVEAELALVTPLGRRFAYVTHGVADDQGWARLRVAYPTEATLPTRPLGLYQVRAGNQDFTVVVSEEDVREGRHVRPDPAF